jgi:hypothetical protein
MCVYIYYKIYYRIQEEMGKRFEQSTKKDVQIENWL